MTPIILHPHQQKLKGDIYNSWNSGARNVCAVLPTGGGKSVVMSDIVNDAFHVGMRQGVIAHRNELVTQMSTHIARRGIYHKIIGSDDTISQAVRKHRAEFGRSFVNPTAPTNVIGVDTLMARKDNLTEWCKQLDRWYIDEGHHTVGNWEVDQYGNPVYNSSGEIKQRVEPNKWGRAVQLFTNAHGLGVTATPVRADGQGLGWEYDGVFNSMVIGPSMRWLIDNNFLAEYEIRCPTSDLQVFEEDVSKDGDWSSKTLRKAAKKSHIVGDVAENYAKYAFGRRAIVFATDVETAGEIADQFKVYGIKAVSLSAKTATNIREKYLLEFSIGAIQVIVNVDLFDEGFDCPACDVVILARPTASLGKYLQMVGRALRYQPNKIALIIDHVSNVVRHLLPDKDRIWSLARREKRAKQQRDPEEIPLTTCRNCSKPYEAFRVACPYCGAEKPLPEPRSRSIEMVDGDLVLLTKEMLDELRKGRTLESAADVGQRVAAAAGQAAGAQAAMRQKEKIASHRALDESIAQWAGIERAKGFSDSEIYRKFYLTLGMDMMTALNASQPRADMDKIRETVDKWWKR